MTSFNILLLIWNGVVLFTQRCVHEMLIFTNSSRFKWFLTQNCCWSQWWRQVVPKRWFYTFWWILIKGSPAVQMIKVLSVGEQIWRSVLTKPWLSSKTSWVAGRGRICAAVKRTDWGDLIDYWVFFWDRGYNKWQNKQLFFFILSLMFSKIKIPPTFFSLISSRFYLSIG